MMMMLLLRYEKSDFANNEERDTSLSLSHVTFAPCTRKQMTRHGEKPFRIAIGYLVQSH
jgi:hypothetical protein